MYEMAEHQEWLVEALGNSLENPLLTLLVMYLTVKVKLKIKISHQQLEAS